MRKIYLIIAERVFKSSHHENANNTDDNNTDVDNDDNLRIKS